MQPALPPTSTATIVAGTIAGDDTILLVTSEGSTRQQLIDELATIIPAVKSVLL